MNLGSHPPRANTNRLRNAAFVVAGAAAIFTLNWIPPFNNELWLPTLLLGPVLTGLVMRLADWPWKLGAASWALTGLSALLWDWILNNEDQAFHAVLTIIEPLLVAIGAAIGLITRSLKLRLSHSRDTVDRDTSMTN
jgi:hypothetical protein